MYIYSLIFWSLDLAKLSNKEKFFKFAKPTFFFRKFGVMKMVLASAREKGAGTIVLSFFFGGLMDFDPRLSFCAIFSSTVRCQRTATYWTWK